MCQRRQSHRHKGRRCLAWASLACKSCLAPPPEHQTCSSPVLARHRRDRRSFRLCDNLLPLRRRPSPPGLCDHSKTLLLAISRHRYRIGLERSDNSHQDIASSGSIIASQGGRGRTLTTSAHERALQWCTQQRELDLKHLADLESGLVRHNDLVEGKEIDVTNDIMEDLRNDIAMYDRLIKAYDQINSSKT